MMMETARVSATVLEWLDDPFSVPADQPHCSFCNTPKIERNKKCEVCGGLSAITGRKTPQTNVFVEPYIPKRVVRIKRKKPVSVETVTPPKEEKKEKHNAAADRNGTAAEPVASDHPRSIASDIQALVSQGKRSRVGA